MFCSCFFSVCPWRRGIFLTGYPLNFSSIGWRLSVYPCIIWKTCRWCWGVISLCVGWILFSGWVFAMWVGIANRSRCRRKGPAIFPWCFWTEPGIWYRFCSELLYLQGLIWQNSYSISFFISASSSWCRPTTSTCCCWFSPMLFLLENHVIFSWVFCWTI